MRALRRSSHIRAPIFPAFLGAALRTQFRKSFFAFGDSPCCANDLAGIEGEEVLYCFLSYARVGPCDNDSFPREIICWVIRELG